MRKWVLTFILLLFTGCLQQNFRGVPLSPAKQAPDFTLTNQFGERVALSDFRGRVVAMSFLYTRCLTICPVITHKFAKAAKDLGDSSGKDVIFVAVTVDPEGDTIDRIMEYSAKSGVGEGWQYLTGKRSELEGVWRDYGIYVEKRWDNSTGTYFIDHTATTIVIDRAGNLRLVFPGTSWQPDDLVHDILILMEEER